MLGKRKNLQAAALFLLLVLFFVYMPVALAKKAKPPSNVTVLFIYAQDANDHYPMPSDSLRHLFYQRFSDFYRTMSYGQHRITIKEVTHNGGFHRSEHTAAYYKKHYDRSRHVRGFGMFNEEILSLVLREHGESIFRGVDLIIVVGTDGGPDWYAPRVNATGFGMLGVDFRAGDKLFGRRQRQGGITVEIGSDIGTDDPGDDFLYSTQEILWTLAHEYGHWLGLGHRSKKLGGYALMGPKLFDNLRMPEYGPPPLDIFQIMQLGWLDETDTSRVVVVRKTVKSTKVFLQQIRSRTGKVLARVDIPGSRERFYLAYHRRDSNPYDGVYMGQGVLVWHVRGRVLDVECAVPSGRNGRDHLDDGIDLGGRATDFFCAQTQTQFTPLTIPGTGTGLRYQQRHHRSGVSITDITETGDGVRFKVQFE